MKPYLRSGSVTAWSDQQIASGSQWFEEIQAALSKTSVAVLLVSPTFLASDFIHEHELGPLLKEAQTGGVRLLWTQIRACAYEETPLAKYQAVVAKRLFRSSLSGQIPPKKSFAAGIDRRDKGKGLFSVQKTFSPGGLVFGSW